MRAARWIAPIFLLLVLVLLAIGSATGGERSSSVLYVDPVGWTLNHPTWMHVERSTSGPGHLIYTEVTFASFVPSRGVRTGGSNGNHWIRALPPVGPEGSFPRDGVAVRLLSLGGLGPSVFPPRRPDSRFPIELSTFRPSRLPRGVRFNATTGETVESSHYRGVPRSIARSIKAYGYGYTAIAWIGPAASPARRAALARAIESLSFARISQGPFIGPVFTILGSAGRYPVGSFTLVNTSGCTPPISSCADIFFYVVRAPGRPAKQVTENCPVRSSCPAEGTFYAIGWRLEGVPGGYRSSCDLRFDRHDEQFYCTNSRARWDRVGRVLRRPAGARADDALQFTPVKITWDGRVSFDTLVDQHPPGLNDARRLWPGWAGR